MSELLSTVAVLPSAKQDSYMLCFPIDQNRSREAWRGGEYFKSLTTEALRDFESLESFRTCAGDTALFVEGQVPWNIFIVMEGHVKLSVNSSNGRRLILRIAKPGEILGLTSVLSGDAYEMTAEK